MKSWKKDIITGAVTIVLFLVYYSQTFSIRQTTLIKLTSTFIPRMCVVFGVLLGAIIVLKAIGRWREEKAAAAAAAAEGAVVEQTTESKQGGSAKVVAAILSFVLLFLGILIMKTVGFFYGGAFYLMGFFLLCSRHLKRNWPLYVILAIVVPVLIYMAFAWGFHLRLPAGALGLLGGIL